MHNSTQKGLGTGTSAREATRMSCRHWQPISRRSCKVWRLWMPTSQLLPVLVLPLPPCWLTMPSSISSCSR